MKKQLHCAIAVAMAAAATVPWRIMNKGDGAAGPQDGTWYRFNNLAAEDQTTPLEIEIYGEIGSWGKTAAQFLEELKAADDGKRQIVVAINSVGGEVGDGFAIHNALQRLGERVTARIDGFAISAAGVVAMGAHKVQMHDNAMLMMHNPWAWAAGDSEEFRKVADIMDQMLEGIIASFKHRPNLTVDDAELRRMINAETWLTAAEAKGMGFVDEVLTGAGSVSNTTSLRILNRYRNMPESVRAQVEKEPEQPADPDVPPTDEPTTTEPQNSNDPDKAALAALAVAECSKAGIADHADVIIKASGLKDEAAIKAAVKQAKDVKALCVLAKQAGMAPDLIKDCATVDVARSKLFDKLVANSGQVEITNHPKVDDQPAPSAKAVDPGAVYAKRRNQQTASKGAQA
ncbi:ATP-dependent Clp protease ClpP [Halopseudomonas aestusnigri]|uniref:head maturation protease, ClpP-related n=1 Tax=Halopseudomonas TaxID=2901189 RepID=UPI0022B72BDC|nr:MULTISPECIES: head maturation protease, ClpP-related [Halopseudomonas]BDX19685.1 ATP-dependent Clp protease ClpP [Halopseudomonas aestusnigri]